MADSSPSGFVGRAAQLARLVAAMEDAGQGGSPAIVIEGESGAGKTRLLREFAAVAGSQGATVLFGRCVDCGDAGPPFWPFTEALRPLPDGNGVANSTGTDRARYFEEVLDRLEDAARRSPVILLLDDLHWADRSTRDLLGFLLANLAGGPGPLVVMTVRSEALIPGHPLVPLLAELRRSRRAEFVRLDRLGKADVAAQLESILGEVPEPELLEEIWRRSEGNPFFVEELLAAARSGHELTASLQPILAARLGALSPNARAAAGAVAASVGPVSHELLTEVAELAEPALLAGLRECVDHHVLVADARAGTYSFRHSLLEETAYAGLLPGEATRLHAAYGRALSGEHTPTGPGRGGPAPADQETGRRVPAPADQETGRRGPAPADLAAVAWHLYAAGDAEQGLPAALAAAVAAEAACGYAEAHVQYERALELAERLPAEALESAFLKATQQPSGTPVHGSDQAAQGEADPAFPALETARSGTPVQLAGRLDRVGLAERAAEAAQLAGAPGRAVELLEIALGGGRAEDASRLYLALGRARWAAGDSAGALEAYDEAIRQLVDPETAEGVRAVAAAAEARMLAGRYAESRTIAEQALDQARQLGLPLEEAEILGTLGVDLALLGDADSAMAALDEAVQAAEMAIDPAGGGGGPAPTGRGGVPAPTGGGRGPAPAGRGRGPAPTGRGGVPAPTGGGRGPAPAGRGRGPAPTGGGRGPAPTGGGSPTETWSGHESRPQSGSAEGRGPRRLARALLNRAEVLAGPLNRLEEASELAAEGVERLRRLGLDRSYGAAMAAILANTLFRAGRWDDADPVIDAALAERPTGAAAIELLLARARLAVGRGRFDAARADLERVDHRWTQAVAPRYRVPLLTLEAGLALWEGRTADAREAVVKALELTAGSDDVWLVAPVLWHGLRAEGDRAERARALSDSAEAKAASDAAAALVERARALQEGAAPAVRPVVAAYEALCVAEARRAGVAHARPGAADADRSAGTEPIVAETRPPGGADPRPGAADADRGAGTEPTPSAAERETSGAYAQTIGGDAEAWAEAAARWAALDQPYPSAYAQFREAQALLSRQARSARAAVALRAAHEVAGRLGSEPFRREIEALAGRARLTLGTPPARPGTDWSTAGAGVGQVAAPGAQGPLDALTARELDVLGLMVEGHTNREIATALFISAKTASVHVSHILAKLGVRSRVQAVAVAHQVGMGTPP